MGGYDSKIKGTLPDQKPGSRGKTSPGQGEKKEILLVWEKAKKESQGDGRNLPAQHFEETKENILKKKKELP